MKLNEKDAIVIVGAGEAGVAGASALRGAGWTGQIILVGDEDSLPYERPPLSKATLSDDDHPGRKLLITLDRLMESGIEYLRGERVLQVDRAKSRVILSSGRELSYRGLLLATGAYAREIRFPGSGRETVALRTYEEAMRIRQAIHSGSRVVIVGGGFIGLEVAASAVTRGASVTVIEAGSRILARAVPASTAERILQKHEGHGVRVCTNAVVERIDQDSGHDVVVLADGRSFPADLVVVGVGATPNVKLAQLAGLAVDNGISVNERLQTSDPNIFAAGDCCSFPQHLYGRRIRLENWRNAQRQGRAAALNMLGAESVYDEIPWFWSDQYDETLQIVGLCQDGDTEIVRDLGPKGRISYFLGAGGHLNAACGFGSLGAIAKEIRSSETLISRGITPDKKALQNASISLKSFIE